MPLSQLKPKSDSAVVRNMLGEIETALNVGASRESIWKMLCEEQGLTLTFEGFVKALWRARRSQEQPTLRQSQPAELESRTPAPISRSTERFFPDEKNQEASDKPQGAEAKRNRIKTTRDFERVHSMDFSEFDDKFK
jgi:hypothetical protein